MLPGDYQFVTDPADNAGLVSFFNGFQEES
jgi:hypothetical protein